MIIMRSLINKRKEQTIIMANFGLNFAMWILGLAGEHDAQGVGAVAAVHVAGLVQPGLRRGVDRGAEGIHEIEALASCGSERTGLTRKV